MDKHRCLRDTALILCVALAAVLASPSSHAGDSSIEVKAEVYAEACMMTSDSELEIDFGDLYAMNLLEAGAASAWVNAPKIELSCPAGTSGVVAKFDGTADGAALGTFKNDGTAKNVSIELQMQSGLTIAPGSTADAPVTSGKAEYALRARVYTKNGAVEAGTVSATSSFTLAFK